MSDVQTQDQMPMDQATYDEKCEAIFGILDTLVMKLEEVEQKQEQLEKMIVNDLFGGIENLYKENQKSQGIADIKGKYGSMFEPFMSALNETDPGVDIYDKLHEVISEMRGSEGYTEDSEKEKVGGFAKNIEDKLREMGKLEPVASVEVTKVSGDEPPVDGLTSKIRAMKEKNKSRGREPAMF